MGVATTNARFNTTDWSLVISAQRDRSALGDLLDLYWTPVYAYVRRAGFSRDDAAELTQEFIAEVVLRRDFVGRADPAAGRFRSYLKAALRNFIIDHARARSAKRAEPANVARNAALLEAAEPPSGIEPADAYDRQWAKAVLTVALERVRRECGAEGLAAHWHAFERRVLAPEMRGGDAPSLDALAQEVGAGGADAVAGMIFTVKRRLRTAIRQAVAETITTTCDLDAELAALRGALCR